MREVQARERVVAPMKMKKRQDAILSMLSQFVVMLPVAAKGFCDVVGAEPDEREQPLKVLCGLERDADILYVKLLRKVAATFITPYDREDLYRTLDKLDDVIDDLEQAGLLLVGFGDVTPPEEFRDYTSGLIAMCEQTCDMVSVLKKPKKFEKHLVEFYDLKAVTDERYRTLLVADLTPGADPIRAMQTAALLDWVRRAGSDLEEFVRSMGAIAIKET